MRPLIKTQESQNLALLFFFRKFFPATFPFLPNNFQKCTHYTFIQTYTYIRDSRVWEKSFLKTYIMCMISSKFTVPFTV